MLSVWSPHLPPINSTKSLSQSWPKQASFKSIEAELTLEELPTTGTVAPSCARMLEEAGFKSPPRPSSSRSEDGYTEPTWTRLGLGGCPMKRTTTRGGERQTAWSAFVRPVTTMPNLKIKDDAAVSRVIIEGGRAVGVEVVESAPGWWWWMGGGRRRTRVRQLRLAKDRAEIVVCCGAFRSPKLLMLSGVGPRRHLEEKGVPVVVDMPHVSEGGAFFSCNRVGSVLCGHVGGTFSLSPCLYLVLSPSRFMHSLTLPSRPRDVCLILHLRAKRRTL